LTTDLELFLNNIFKVATLDPLLSVIILHIDLLWYRAWNFVNHFSIISLTETGMLISRVDFLTQPYLFGLDWPRLEPFVQNAAMR
jgi:hypothetical protein